jgi:dihydrofolate reductase
MRGQVGEIPVPKLRVNAFSISLDGYGAGADQSRKEPLGRGGESLHNWLFPTQTFQSMQGGRTGTTGTDEDFAARSMAGLGAWIMGRNMFTVERGPWSDLSWKGWWGENPPYHTPVFVLTHHARAPIPMKGGTEFRFVTGGIRDALEQAKAAAGEKDIRLLGGVSTIRQYLEAKLVDEVHLALSPVLLGSGEHLLAGLDLEQLGYHLTEHSPSKAAMHVVLTRRG